MESTAGETVSGLDVLTADESRGDSGPGVGEVQIWCVTLSADPALVARARPLLSSDECARADRFYFPRLRDEFTVWRAVLRVLISPLIGAAPDHVQFTYGPQGKPALARDVTSGVQFNVSHSGGMLACAVTRGLPLGVDVEHHRPIADLTQVARRFFSHAEVRDLMCIAEPARTAAFYNCWSRKEAFIKALGGGLSIPLDSFRVSLEPGRAALLEVRDAPGEAAAWTIRAFGPAAGFSGALAIRHPAPRVDVRYVSAAQIFADGGLT